MKRIILSLLLLLPLLGLSQSVDGPLKTITALGTNTYTTVEPLPAVYTLNERFLVRFTNANTGASTLNRAGLGAKTIKKVDGTDFGIGELKAATYLMSYNGTNYQVVGDGGGGAAAWGSISGTLSAQTDLQSALNGKQATLISGTNIKTVNGSTLLGSGDLTTSSAWGSITGTLSSQTDLNTALSGKWSLSSGGTFTAPLTFTGSTTNTLQFNYPSIGGVHSNPGVGLLLKNPTLALVGSQIQQPPSLTFEGNGWKTNATAGSQPAQLQLEPFINPGAVSPSIGINIYDIINGVRGSSMASISKGGTSFVANTFSANPLSGVGYSIIGSALSSSLYSSGDTFVSAGPSNESSLQLFDPAGSNAVTAGGNIVINNLATGSTANTLIINGDYVTGGVDVAGMQIYGSKTVGISASDAAGTSSSTINVDYTDGISLNTTNSAAIVLSPVTDSDDSYINIQSGPGAKAAILLGNSSSLANDNYIQMYVTDDFGVNSGFNWQTTSAGGAPGFSIFDNRTTPTGLVYQADYSPTYTTRSLVDKGYTLGAKTYTGKQTFLTSGTGAASLNIPHGAAPTTPVNGDVWTTTTGMFARINGATVGPFGAGGGGGITNGALNNQVMISDGTNAIGNANFTFTGSQLTLSGNTLSSGTSQMLLVLGKAHTNQTASVAATDVVFDLSATMQYATGAITDLPSILVKPRTYSFVGASTVSVASSMEIAGYPIAGTNATMTKAAGLYINPTASTIPSTGTTYGLYVDSNGYTFYHAAAFNGKVLTIMTGTAPLNIGNGNSDPGSNNIDGDMYLNTTIGDLKIRTGGVHVPIVTFPKALSIAFLKL